MSYLDHIKKCNTISPANYLPFMVGNEQLGFIQKTFSEHLLKDNDVFLKTADAICINPKLNTVDSRTQACHPVLWMLHQQGIIDTWVDELYAVTNTYGEKPRFLIERASVSFFGFRGYGVHINGLVKKADGDYVWIAVRAKDKPFSPGKLDQMVAGGQPFGISRMDNVIKESAEEANIPASVASKAELVSEISYQGETHRGMDIDTLFNYDLWLDEDFVPENTDGEVDEFILMPLAEMAEITEKTNQFKANCNLVNIDLLIRKGIINEKHPEYQQIVTSLYQSD